jgi:hypothetical protein
LGLTTAHPQLGQTIASSTISFPHFEQNFIKPSPLAIISQIGIFVLYQNGIIMSRSFVKKGEENGISAQRIAEKQEYIAVEACA